MKTHYHILILIFVLFSLCASCGDDDTQEVDEIPIAMDDDNPSEDDDGPTQDDDEIGQTTEGLEVLNPDLVYDGYILVNDALANRVYLMDKQAEVIYEWNLDGKRLGNDVHLMPDGRLLAMLESDDPQIELGGFGGLLAILDKDGTVEWSFEYSSEDYIAHHDAVMLPNGNILLMTWERKTLE